jgi:hypothetical protein
MNATSGQYASTAVLDDIAHAAQQTDARVARRGEDHLLHQAMPIIRLFEIGSHHLQEP